MKIIRDTKKIIFEEPITASIGGFDGLHLGHQKIIKNIINESCQNKTKSAVITFNPLPKIFFSKKNFELLSIYKKIKILKEFNLDYLIILRFNQEFIQMSPKRFIEDVLIKKLNIKSLTVGHDFKFGYNQNVSVSYLIKYSEKIIFSLNIEKKHCINNNRISSSLIRNAILNNDFHKASKMLGRPYTITGKVIHGEKRGTVIGFPTANIKLKPNILLNGVYAVSTIIDKITYYGIANIGYKPTFHEEKYLFEAHIFNFSCNIYGKRLEFDIVAKIRNTMKFNNIDELKININNDIISTKKLLKII